MKTLLSRFKNFFIPKKKSIPIYRLPCWSEYILQIDILYSLYNLERPITIDVFQKTLIAKRFEKTFGYMIGIELPSESDWYLE